MQTQTVEMDSKGRLSLAKILPADQRGPMTFIVEEAAGGILLQPAVIRPAWVEQLEQDESFMNALQDSLDHPERLKPLTF